MSELNDTIRKNVHKCRTCDNGGTCERQPQDDCEERSSCFPEYPPDPDKHPSIVQLRWAVTENPTRANIDKLEASVSTIAVEGFIEWALTRTGRAEGDRIAILYLDFMTRK